MLKIWWPAKQTAATLTDHVKFLLCIEVVLIKLGLLKKENLISPHHNGRKFKKKKCKKAEEKKLHWQISSQYFSYTFPKSLPISVQKNAS